MLRHHHTTALNRRQPASANPLPGNQYGVLVGTYNHATFTAANNTRQDDNHLFLWLDVDHGTHAGTFECAFNTESNRARGEDAEVMYFDVSENISPGDVPNPGYKDATLAYGTLGLQDAEFQPIINGTLRSLVLDWARESNLVEVYGVTYKEGTGIHDVHRNDDRPDGQDGALAFYYQRSAGPVRHWVFIKFRNQRVDQAAK